MVSYSFDFSGVTHKSLIFLLRHWVMPPWHDLLLMCLLGVCASFGMILFGTAYKLAESSFVAPFEYSSMIWAVLFGFLLFGDIPGLHTISGRTDRRRRRAFHAVDGPRPRPAAAAKAPDCPGVAAAYGGPAIRPPDAGRYLQFLAPRGEVNWFYLRDRL